jgi:hypothetical protein
LSSTPKPPSRPNPSSRPRKQLRLEIISLDTPGAEVRSGMFLEPPPDVDLTTVQTNPIPPGTYRLRATIIGEGYYLVSAKIGDVDVLEKPFLSEGGQVKLDIGLAHGGAALEGTVVNENAEALPYGVVCALSGDSSRLAQPGGTFCVHGLGDGSVRTPWLSPGKWRVWAFIKTPKEKPGTPNFENAYGTNALKLEVTKDGGLPRLPLRAFGP